MKWLLSAIPFVLLNLAGNTAAYASTVHEIVYQGQGSESFEMNDLIKEGVWGNRTAQDVHARVKVEFGPVADSLRPEEHFLFKLNEDSLTVTVKSSGKVLISQKAPEIHMDRNEHRVEIEADYHFSFLDIAPVVDVLDTGITAVEAKNGMIFFEASPEFFERSFMLRLSISKKRLFHHGDLVFDQTIPSSSLRRTATAEGKMLYSSKLATLGVPALENGRYTFDFFVSFDSGSESILNASDLPKEGRLRVKLDARAKDIVEKSGVAL